jgi:predicted metal-dependent hydrolase
MADTDPVDYTLRESRRAKRVILNISVRSGLEIVVPRGFDHRRLPGIIDSKRAWIERTLKGAEETRKSLTPFHIPLRAVGKEWEVQYHPSEQASVSAREAADNLILVRGDVSDVYGGAAALKRWLHRKAIAQLIPWLRSVSTESEIQFKSAMVRGQRTRWASCSSRQTVSLNRNLLFLPDHLVRHVFLHELCHTEHLNHSPRFWQFLQRLEPDYKSLEAELKSAGDYVPAWAHAD